MKTHNKKTDKKRIAINTDFTKLFEEQTELTDQFLEITKRLFENQSKINTLLLKKTDFKIARTLLKNDILTTTETAKWLGYSVSKLYRLRTYEGLPYTKVGKKIMYRRKAIEAYLKEREKVNKTSIFQ